MCHFISYVWDIATFYVILIVYLILPYSMLDEILESRQEANVIGFLLVAPPRSFSELELSSRLELRPGVLMPILEYLVKQSQLKTFQKGGTHYYLLNTKYRMFPEIRERLARERVPYEDELFTAIRKTGSVQAAYLSGLFTGHPELPVDILIVGNVVDDWLRQFLENCERMMQQEINYSVMSVREFRERRNTFDKFIKDIFDYPHLVVVDKLK